jgi:hypothetical protein
VDGPADASASGQLNRKTRTARCGHNKNQKRERKNKMSERISDLTKAITGIGEAFDVFKANEGKRADEVEKDVDDLFERSDDDRRKVFEKFAQRRRPQRSAHLSAGVT